jgi:hypothetical protein
VAALHPYYKLTYIEHVWGGVREQDAKQEAGNWDVKNWQDEARKVLERMASLSHIMYYSIPILISFSTPDGKLLEGPIRCSM